MSVDYFGGSAKPKLVTIDQERAIDEAAEAHGFASREVLKPIPKRRRGTRAQLHNFTMRLAVDDMEAFVSHCERNRLSYREAFSELVRLLPKE